jgi:UDP-N-acetylmuramate-alanine ligase
MADFLVSNAKPNDLLLIMSNGSFDGLCEKLLAKLTASQPVPAGANPR